MAFALSSKSPPKVPSTMISLAMAMRSRRFGSPERKPSCMERKIVAFALSYQLAASRMVRTTFASG